MENRKDLYTEHERVFEFKLGEASNRMSHLYAAMMFLLVPILAAKREEFMSIVCEPDMTWSTDGKRLHAISASSTWRPGDEITNEEREMYTADDVRLLGFRPGHEYRLVYYMAGTRVLLTETPIQLDQNWRRVKQGLFMGMEKPEAEFEIEARGQECLNHADYIEALGIRLGDAMTQVRNEKYHQEYDTGRTQVQITALRTSIDEELLLAAMRVPLKWCRVRSDMVLLSGGPYIALMMGTRVDR